MDFADQYGGMKVTIMGLGLNGGGLESARYLALKGAFCTVTDLRDETVLASSIADLEKTDGLRGKIRYVLGRHEMDDFSNADMVIKNPGVPVGSPYLAAARRVETDISLFLAASPARLSAVTGSKGKSGTASALAWALTKARETPGTEGKAYLGGNITVSPLTFLDRLGADDDVVLELSSWQLGDLALCGGVLKPRCAILTAIMSDHQDRYGSMEAYVNDKREIYRSQNRDDLTVAADDGWGRSFLKESPARTLAYSEYPLAGAGGWLAENGSGFARLHAGAQGEEIVPCEPAVPGRHQKKNLLAAGLALLDLSFSPAFIRESLKTFPGIEHRLEFFHEKDGVRFYNDTAATIPEAAAAAVEALAGANGERSLVLVTGGTDKKLDFTPLVRAASKARGLVLLEGSGSAKLVPLLRAEGISFEGPFGELDRAVSAAVEKARQNSSGGTVFAVLSPGCASFGMFQNEFDRGLQWKEAVRRLS